MPKSAAAIHEHGVITMSTTASTATENFEFGLCEDFELRFNSLFSGRALTFPCDRCGSVNMDAMSEPSRNNYFAARALVGRDFAWPVVMRALH